MTTLKQQVQKAARAVHDDPAAMVCFYRPMIGDAWREEFGEQVRCTFAELPEREYDEGYGGREGEPFIGFTARFVYVCGTYDGSEWIQAVPRHPDVVEATRALPVIGGG